MPTLQEKPFTSRIARPAAWRLAPTAPAQAAPAPSAPAAQQGASRRAPAPGAARRHAHLIAAGPLRGLDDVAIHSIDGVARDRQDRCEPHEHDAPELNLIQPITSLTCEIVLGDERYEVEGPASVYVPAGLAHSINVVAGTGFFVSVALGAR